MALGWPAFSRLFARNRATQLSLQSNLEKFVISSRYSKSKSNSIQSIVINILSDCFLRRKFFKRSISRQHPWDGVDIKLSLPIFTRCLPRVYISIIISSFLFPCCTNNSLRVIKFSNEKFTLDTYFHVQFPLPSLFARLSIPNFKWKIKMSLLHELTTCRLIRPTSVSQTAQPSSTQNLVELGAQ